jgi:hypothetical protein
VICPACGNEFAAAFHCAQCGLSEAVGEITVCEHCGDFLFGGRHKGNVEWWCREKQAREDRHD